MSLTFRSKVAKIWITPRLFCAKLFSKKGYTLKKVNLPHQLFNKITVSAGTTSALTKVVLHYSYETKVL